MKEGKSFLVDMYFVCICLCQMKLCFEKCIGMEVVRSCLGNKCTAYISNCL